MESQIEDGKCKVMIEEIHLQEQFGKQVEDTSKLADQVLIELKAMHEEDGRLMLFVP